MICSIYYYYVRVKSHQHLCHYLISPTFLPPLGPVWYVCLKTEKCCLKIFMEIRVGEKVC